MRDCTVRAVRMKIVLLVVLLASSHLQGQQTAPAIEDVAVLVNILKEGGVTSLQKNAFVGKTYSGVITIEDVSVSPQDSATAFIDVDLGFRARTFNKMRFAAPSNDEKVGKLRKGHAVRVRALLKRFVVVESRFLAVEPTEWAEFTDTVIEGPAGR